MSRACVLKWQKRFKEGREEVKNDPRSERPLGKNDDNTELVRQKVRANELAVGCKRVWTVITGDLEIKRFIAKWFRVC